MWILAALMMSGCGEVARLPVSAGTGPHPSLPAPQSTLIPTVHIAPAVGWPPGTTPQGPLGTQVQAFARDLVHPRWLLVLPNGDVLVAETNAPPKTDTEAGLLSRLRSWVTGLVMQRAGATVPSPNRITLLRDSRGQGVADQRHVLLEGSAAGLHSPFGMVWMDNMLYVANTDAVLRFPYVLGATAITAPGVKLVDLPAGPINHHWTKNLLASPDRRQLYITVGSNSNVAERGMAAEAGRAAIWQFDLGSGAMRPFATGLRNPNGLAWVPGGDTLWTVVNERDELGSDLVPDYLTSVQEGAFYGWPYSWYGNHVDARVSPARPELVAQARVPDYALGPHTAPLGLAWSPGGALPGVGAGMLVGQHGSWNRRPHSGYKVILVPFVQGRPAGQPQDVLTGFLDAQGQALGRPVGVAVDAQGALLVADDVGNIVWRVSARR